MASVLNRTEAKENIIASVHNWTEAILNTGQVIFYIFISKGRN